ncbi:MAG: HPF/RaiA family ribosome-associated protein [Paludibacteraceae bacterium]|nr:HPF/RaiA family ribosome-associated protein [Paludibacteraceae bacterium]
MKVNIQAVNFEIAKKLNDYIEKKCSRFERHLKDNDELMIKLTLVKRETAMNKEAQVRIGNLFAEKVCDTFEEAIANCIDALYGQLERRKN